MQHPTSALELWAGIECTVNRVRNRFIDQVALSGHAERPSDLIRLAALGISALRYPVLWERTEAEPAALRFRWADARLSLIRQLGLRPIVGLVHHGSGPPQTHLLDPRFPELLAAYARSVAERYPWVDDYTPVNEPLTTARFSALYGYWYPHARDDAAFVRALLVQCVAITRAMAAIREVNPHARLVQTEDLTFTHSTPELAYQAEFENQRRWLTLDLLCGSVTPQHPLWSYLRANDADPALLEELAERPCPPDLLGFNYYATSERYLDQRLDRFPPETHGGNGRDRYADLAAARACAPRGPERLLLDAWQRFEIPLALTEVHLNCTREEQLRWLAELWQAASSARERGADVRAVTVWAALGSYDWDSLLREPRGHYETGAYDLRGRVPRSTALVKLARELASSQSASHPVLASPGWWRRGSRLLYDVGDTTISNQEEPDDAPPLLITGKSGTLGRAFRRACERRGLRSVLTGREELDIADEASVRSALARLSPWAVVNAAGYVRVDDAEREPEACWRENVKGAATLARVCNELGIALVTFSSDLVFDGRSRTPYRESDPARPLNVYGQSKLAAEIAVLAQHDRALVVRTAAFFSPWDQANFVTRALSRLLRGEPVYAYANVTVSPTFVPDLIDPVLDLLIDGETGIWHLTNAGQATWYDLATKSAELAQCDRTLVRPREAPSHIPVFTPLSSERASLLPPLEDALACYWQATQYGLKRGEDGHSDAT